MPTPIEPLSQRIASIARTFADPRKVEAALFLLREPDSAATEIRTGSQQDFSTTVKRLRKLEDGGLVSSRKDGAHRRYSLARTEKTVGLMNALLRFDR